MSFLAVYADCITIEYMANTTVMTVRIDRNLLGELKRVAHARGRSVSAEVVQLLRRELAPVGEAVPKSSVEGMFAHREVSTQLADYRLDGVIEWAVKRRGRRLPTRSAP